MKHSLTIVFSTSRFHSEIDWFLDSLDPQIQPNDEIRVVIVDSFHGHRPKPYRTSKVDSITRVPPKPTVWQGDHKVTKEDWWAASNARNTGLCLAESKWVAFLDDRHVLMPGWLSGIRRAMEEEYVACGQYEKRKSMTVESGVIKNAGVITAEDSRVTALKFNNQPVQFMDAPGNWLFGCSFALPVEWALNVNGLDETCDGCSMEDSIFGLMLQNNGYPIKYDPSMLMVEDRTDEFIGLGMRREDKGVSPNDKSHFMLAMLRDRKTAMHPINLREIRKSVMVGNPFPEPWGPEKDFYDGQLISEFHLTFPPK